MCTIGNEKEDINSNMVGFNIRSTVDDSCKPDVNDHSNIVSLQKYTGNVETQSSSKAYEVASVDSTLSFKNYKIYECSTCHIIFNQNSIYKNHLRSHSKDSKNYHCNICGKSFAVPARLTRHYRMHTGEKPFQCEYCSKTFSVKENLSVHRRIHTKERPYKCDICKSAFEHSGKLHRHMRIHTGERPHKCSLCNKTFIQSGQLVIHMRTHTGEKPYVCKLCEKGFTCSKQLKVHMRTHTGEKPYRCNICGKSFGYNHVLKLHQVAHYGEKFYKCTLCQETFNSKKLMEIHIKTHSSSQPDIETSSSTNKIVQPCNSNEVNNVLKGEDQPQEKTSETFNYENNDAQNFVSSDTLQNQHNKLDDETFVNTDFFTSKHSDIVTRVKDIEENSKKNCLSTYRRMLTDFNSSKSYSCKIKKDSFFPENNLTKYSSTSDEFEKQFEIDLKLSKEQYPKTRESDSTLYTEKYDKIIDTSVCGNPLDLVIPNFKSQCSLPPRKRCKMILDSMEIEQSKLVTAKRCNSVIKFAKAENTNLSYK